MKTTHRAVVKQIEKTKAEIAFWADRVTNPVDACEAGIRLDKAALAMHKGRLQKLQALKCQIESRAEVKKLFG